MSNGSSPSTTGAGSGWNLKNELAKRLLRDMIAKGRGKDSGVVLVVDMHTSKILSSCLRMHDLLSCGVLVLQNLCVHRERLDLPAIYFVEPNEDVLELIASDFPKPPPVAAPTKEKGFFSKAMQALSLSSTPPPSTTAHLPKSQYAYAHLFFTSTVPAPLIAQLQSSNIDMKKIKSFVELNIDFLAFEQRVFLLDQPHWIQRLYFPVKKKKGRRKDGDGNDEEERGNGDDEEHDEDDGPSNATLQPLVLQIVSALRTFLPPNERPYVRHISEELNIGKTYISGQLAGLVDREMGRQLKAAAAEKLAAEKAAAEKAAAAEKSDAPAPSSSAAASILPSTSSNAPFVPSLHSAPPTRNTTLLIVDRSLDPLTPLMHEFTFQAMIQDLLKVTGLETVHLQNEKKSQAASAASSAPSSGSNSASSSAQPSPSTTMTNEGRKQLQQQLKDVREGRMSEVKEDGTSAATPAAAAAAAAAADESDAEVVLSEEDTLWLEYRHRHIGEVMISVNRKLKEFASSNKMAQYQHLLKGKQIESIKDILKAVNEIPEYKVAMKRFTKHVDLAKECLDKFKARSLQILGELEQSLATNTDPDNRIYTSNKEMKDLLKECVSRKDISILDKLRLCAIYAIVQGGITDSLMKVLSVHVHPKLLKLICQEQLAELGVELDAYTCQLARARIIELQDRNAEQTMALMRYTPSLQSIMEGLVANTLPLEQFPYTRSGTRPITESETGTKKSSSNGVKGSSKDKKLDAETRARMKVLEDAEKDTTHRPTGRSARRRTSGMEGERGSISAHSSAEDPGSFSFNNPSSSLPNGPPRHRYIVFMLGGVTFSEMRACYTVSELSGSEMIIGSTATLTPQEFLLDLSGLKRKEFYQRVAASAGIAVAPDEPSVTKKGTTSSATAATPKADVPPPSSSAATDKVSTTNGSATKKKPAATPTPAPAPEPTQRDAMSSDDDVDDPGSDDDEPAPAPQPVKRRTKKLTSNGSSATNGHPAPSRSSTPPINNNGDASSSKPKPIKKERELVFESASDDDEEQEQPRSKRMSKTPTTSSASKPPKVPASARSHRSSK